MELASSSSSGSAAASASSWVSHLSVFPAKLRVEIQKTVTADMVVQQKQMPPQQPFSRAYASGSTGGRIRARVKTGLGAPRQQLEAPGIRREVAGAHVSSVSRKFESTADMLAGLLLQAIAATTATTGSKQGHTTTTNKSIGEPKIPFGIPNSTSTSASMATTTTSSSSPSSSLLPSDQRSLLAAELHAYGLDAAYRVPVARNLQRRLGGPTGMGATQAIAAAAASAGSGVAAGAGGMPDISWIIDAEAGRFPVSTNKTVTGAVATSSIEQLETLVLQATNRQKEEHEQQQRQIQQQQRVAQQVTKINDADLSLLDDAFDEIE